MVPASSTIVDEIARRLAEQAGVVWATLSNHPGYQKYIFREQARELLAATGAAAVPVDDERPVRVPKFLVIHIPSIGMVGE